MGSLWGHIDEGLAFIFLGLWWMFNFCKCQLQLTATDDRSFAPEVSYKASFRGRSFNWEIYAKIFVPIGGFLIELFNSGVPVTFLDSDGNFRRVSSLQHMSIYTLFILHGVIDLLRYKKILIIGSLEYLSLFMAFTWYGLIFYFHTQSGADKMENIIHSLGMVWCFSAAISVLWECRTVHKLLPNFSRSLMVMCLGTWFFHTPFYLYAASDFPGQTANPRWDRDDNRNAQFIATMFGFHLFVNMIVSLVIFVLVRLVNSKTKGGLIDTMAFQSLPQEPPDEIEEKSPLLEGQM